MEFWYRQSPRQFEPVAFWEWFFPGRVTETDPPSDTSGMATVWLSPRGNPWPLRASAAGGECLLTSAAAGLESVVRRGRSGFGEVVGNNTAVDPRRFMPMSGLRGKDHFPSVPSVPVRIEAAAYRGKRGKPVYFQFCRTLD